MPRVGVGELLWLVVRERLSNAIGSVASGSSATMLTVRLLLLLVGGVWAASVDLSRLRLGRVGTPTDAIMLGVMKSGAHTTGATYRIIGQERSILAGGSFFICLAAV